MNKWRLVGCVLAGSAVLFPLSNLVIPETPRPHSPVLQHVDPRFVGVAKTFEAKCLDCHGTQTRYPWYVSLPVAQQIMTQDIEMAHMAFNMDDELGRDSVSLVTLAKLDYVVRQNRMPPWKYSALHWNTRLTPQEQSQILMWIEHERAKHQSSHKR